jgi:hypothetical protein
MTASGQSLHFDSWPATSDFTSTPDMSLHRTNLRDGLKAAFPYDSITSSARPTKQIWAPWRPSSSQRKPLRTLPQAHNSGLLFTGDASVVLAGVGPPPKTQESLLLA